MAAAQWETEEFLEDAFKDVVEIGDSKIINTF